MKIVVLAGGRSPEREVSLCSGKMIASALIGRGHSVALLDPAREISVLKEQFFRTYKEIEKNSPVFDASPLPENVGAGSITESVLGLIKTSAADRVFLALHGGDGENGNLQALFGALGIGYNGSPPSACAAAMDKILTKKLFASAGILTPKYTVYRKGQPSPPLPPKYPCVVKPADGGSSVGVSFVMRPFGLSEAVEKALLHYDTALIEEAIFGRELTVGVLQDKALAVTEISPKNGFYDYDNKYINGRSREITPAPLTSEQTSRALRIAQKAHQALGMRNFSRTDFILEQETGLLYALEINALPGMTETSLLPQAAKYRGIDYGELCELMLES